MEKVIHILTLGKIRVDKVEEVDEDILKKMSLANLIKFKGKKGLPIR
ncbi:MAG: hypothetical protein QXX95_04135 [Nitrososphaerales archaeon]